MDGFEAIKKLVSLCPDVRAFLVSGDVWEKETLLSLVPKRNFNILDVVKRSRGMTRFYNRLEINIRQAEYENGFHFA